MSRKALLPLIVTSVILMVFAGPRAQTTKSRVGKLEFDGGYPSKKTVERMYETMDLQRTVQAYLLTVPLVGFAQWKDQHEDVFGAEDGDVVYYASHQDKLGMLTPDAVAPYVVGFYDLKASGPLIIEYPSGPTVGRVLNVWQRPIGRLGLDAEGGDAGGKYLVMMPGQSIGDVDGCTIIESDSYNIAHGLRILSTDTDEIEAIRESYRAYPYTSRHEPRPTQVITPDGREWSGRQPRGLAYWELVSRMIREEPTHDLDRVILSTLDSVGIEERRPFDPDDQQKVMLEEATVIGEAMAASLSFALRQKDDAAYPGTNWRIPILFGDHREVDPGTVINHRAARFYQANGLSADTTIPTRSQKLVSLSAFRDKGGRWLQGENSYRLRIPPNPPGGSSWAVTIYDAGTRSFVDTEHQIVGVNSRMDLTRNEDGTIFLYFGPKEPNDEAKRKNWIPTLKDRGWFAYILLREPTDAFFDQTWPLPDIRRTDDGDDLYGGGG
jgi:hypothetical protein